MMHITPQVLSSSAWKIEDVSPMMDVYSPNGSDYAAYSLPPSPPHLQHEQPIVTDNQNQSPQSAALAFCRGIDRIEVRGTTRRGERTFYNVHIFLKKPHNGFPIASQPSWTVGDIVLQRRFSAFVTLRHEAFFHAHTGHASSTMCSFCSQMTHHLEQDGSTSSPLHTKLFLGEATICGTFEDCLRTILELTQTLPMVAMGRSCEGEELIPSLLHKFLTNADEI